uniref:Uncharacterized protein n=1 Tax=Rhizophora mucronata TaxID=61149 RepID=A0A2P2NTU1_RHIMU
MHFEELLNSLVDLCYLYSYVYPNILTFFLRPWLSSLRPIRLN